MTPVKVAFLLHFYQPPTQEEKVFRKIVDQSYKPLLRLIKERKSFSFTFNFPLSTLEQLDIYGYKSLLEDIKNLVSAGRVELTGSGAYHPLLSELPKNIAEEQIILNEYGLGYYFGGHRGFEGEKAILLKDVRGFFSPEMAIDGEVVSLVRELGYFWLVADKTALYVTGNNKPGLYSFGEDGSMGIVVRDRKLSNMISFKRDPDVLPILNYLKSFSGVGAVVALDAETFGHHYDEGILLFENLLIALSRAGVKATTVSHLVEEMDPMPLDSVASSSWGASDADMEAGTPLPLWDVDNNQIQKLLWEIQDTVVKAVPDVDLSSVDDFETLPVWLASSLSSVEDLDLKKSLTTRILLHKSLHSDQFWWASKKDIMGDMLFNPVMIRRALDLYDLLVETSDDPDLADEVNKLTAQIRELL